MPYLFWLQKNSDNIPNNSDSEEFAEPIYNRQYTIVLFCSYVVARLWGRACNTHRRNLRHWLMAILLHGVDGTYIASSKLSLPLASLYQATMYFTMFKLVDIFEALNNSENSVDKMHELWGSNWISKDGRVCSALASRVVTLVKNDTK